MNVRLLDRLPPKRRKLLIWAVSLLVAYTVIGFLILPPIAKAVAIQQISKQLGRDVSIRGLRLNPYALSITINGLLIKEKSGEPFVSWERLYVNFQLSSIFLRALVFDEISLSQPYGHIVINKDGSYNFSDILKKLAEAAAAEKPKPKEPSTPLTIRIGKLQIAGGQVACSDLSRRTPFATTFGPINVEVLNFSTRPDNKNPYVFAATTESGGRFAYRGYFYLDPLRSGGDFSLENIPLRKYEPYYEDKVQFAMKDGSVNVAATYRVELTPGKNATYLTNATVVVQSLKISGKGSAEDAIDVGNVTVSNAYIDAVAQIADIGSVTTTRGNVILRRLKDGTINLATMLTPVPAATNAPPAAASARTPNATANKPSWVATIRAIQAQQYAMRFEDFSNPRPVKIDFDQIALALTNVSTAPGAVMGVSLSHRWNQTGAVKVEGTFSLSPVKADANLGCTDIPLRPGDPYLDQAVSLLITDGALSMNGHARISLPEGGKPLAWFQGDIGIKHFATVDGVRGEDFVKWQSLQLSKLDFQLDPMSMSIGAITVADPYVHLIVWSNKTMNVAAILKKEAPATEAVTNAPPAQAAPPTTASPAAPAVTMPKITVGAIVLTNATFGFTDNSVKPSASMSIVQFGGTISELSSEELQSATVNLAGKVDGSAPFEIKGRINPLTKTKQTDLTVVFNGIDLTPASPYTGKYIGNMLAKGKLSLNLKYLIDKRNLNAKNVINVDQLTLGQKVDSPDATKLPVGLAIALLKDVNGRIHIDVPVQGNLDDPKFRLGKLIWQTLLNLVVKAATSPFRLIGSMFGGGGEELSYQEFVPGSTQLQTNETKKLDVIVKALTERPGLSLEIEGSIDEEKDREALRRQRLEQRLRTMKFQELRQSGQTAVSPEQITLTQDEYARYLKAAYLESSLEGGLPKPISTATTQAPGPTTARANQPAAVEPSAPAATDLGTKPWNRLGKETPSAQPSPGAPPPAKSAVRTSQPKTGEKKGGAKAKAAAAPPPTENEVAEMERPLLDAIEINADDFRLLASDRAKRVRDYILQSGKVPAERLFVTETSGQVPPNKGSRVNFNLR